MFISMDGSVNHWFKFWKRKTPNPSWNELKDTFFRIYGGWDKSFVFEKLTKIKQKGSMEEFVQEFKALVSQAPNIMEEQLLGYFLVGLQLKI